MLPDLNLLNSRGYYRYMGSLTTPPCTDGVIWTVWKETLKITPEQVYFFSYSFLRLDFLLEKKYFFFKLHLLRENQVSELNFRSVQSLNSRRIFKSFNGSTAKARIFKFFYIFLIFSIYLILYWIRTTFIN